MQAQVLLTKPITQETESRIGPYFPIRVFLLSDCRLLREAFTRALKNHSEIVLVGAGQFSAATPADIIESACDILLMDPVNISTFDTRILDALKAIFFDFKIVIIDPLARINDVFSSVLRLGQNREGFACGVHPVDG